MSISNVIASADGGVVADLVEANFTNCIIYGNEQRELGFTNEPSAAFNVNFANTLIRFEDPNGDFNNIPEYNFNNSALYTNSVLNMEPVFQNTNLNNFNIEQGTSGAEGIGLGGVAPSTDLNGTTRDTSTPDAGAYETTVFPDPDGD